MGSKTTSKTGKGSGKQNAGKVSAGKGHHQQEESDSQEQNVVHRTDLSVLRQPINISVRRVCDIVKMYQTCTPELRHLLDNEVEIVYECKVCRNLFRSMANIISHKRVYCMQQYNEAYYSFNKRHTVDDYTVIIQPEPVVPASSENETWRTSDKAPTHDSSSEVTAREIKATVPRINSSSRPKKDLTQIIEELSDKRGLKNFKETVAHCSTTSFYEDVNKSLISRAQKRKEHAIHLEPTGSSSGVFQTKLQTTTATTIQAENIDLMKAQVIELQHMVRETEAVLDEEGRIVQMKGTCNGPLVSANKETSPIISPSNNKGGAKNDHVCSQCGLRFSTRKTLSHHMRSLHTAYRLCYPCPCCKNTFTNSWSVYRHLYKVHRKTTAQVRKLRPQIQSKAFKREIVVDKHGSDTATIPKVQPSEQDAARKEQSRIDRENKEWMDNFEDDQELQRCGGCGRRFERRAALTSHSQICQKRIAARKVKPASTGHGSSEKSLLKNGNIDTAKPTTSVRETESKAETGVVSEAVHRTRHPSGSNWSDPPKKEILGKRIEIQIRRDYCKFGSSVPSSSHQQSNNFSRSESPESVPNVSPTVKDETESLLSEAEMDTDFSKTRNCNSAIDVLLNPIADSDKPIKANSMETSQTDSSNPPETDDLGESHKKSARARSAPRPRKRQASADKELTGNCASITPRKRRATSDGVSEREGGSFRTNSERRDDAKRRTHRSSSVEHFSPIMERKMHALINLKRLQCLPCQKKFNKLPNLRRHVAVHIGWNRYRCPVCSYKCFAKYDCVHHINKVHGNERSEAQQMVQLIESQGLDNTVSEKSPVLTLALKAVENAFETRVAEKIVMESCTFTSEDIAEASVESEKSVAENGVGVSYVADSPEPQNCKTEEDNVEVLILDGESASKDSDLRDTSPLNCLGDAELDDSEVSYSAPDGEPVIRSLENNCNDAVLDFIGENFQNAASSINGDHEDDRVQQYNQIESDDSRPYYEDDSDRPENEGSRRDDSDLPENEEGPASPDSKKNALRRMVMEVIFGSASVSQMEPRVAVINGFEDSRGSPEGRAEDGSEGSAVDPQEDVIIFTEEEQAEEAVAVHSDSSSHCSSRSGVERRKQPLRTRVCVRHDDFIYEGPSSSGVPASKKVQRPQMQQVVDEGPVERVPKMTLVRVEGNGPSAEAAGVSSWRTAVHPVTDNLAVASTSRTSVSLLPRKSKVTDVIEKSNSK